MTKKNVMERDTIRADKPATRGEPVFLVMERDPLVANDIMDSLAAIGPCRVLHAGDSCAVSKVLRDEGRISAAFLDVCFESVLNLGLDEILHRHGARIILTVGEEDQARTLARGWGMLVRPFTDNMIREVVAPSPLV